MREGRRAREREREAVRVVFCVWRAHDLVGLIAGLRYLITGFEDRRAHIRIYMYRFLFFFASLLVLRNSLDLFSVSQQRTRMYIGIYISEREEE